MIEHRITIMPPEPDLDKTQSADEDENSDPFTDVHIDEDIDSAMKSWEGLMNKKHSKVHKQALKLPEGDRPEPGQGNLQLHPDLEARGRGAAQVEQGGGLRTSPRVSKRKRGFIDTDDEMLDDREETSEKVVANSWVAATVSVSLHPLVIRNISEHWSR